MEPVLAVFQSRDFRTDFGGLAYFLREGDNATNI
jgi:hypothetical protein